MIKLTAKLSVSSPRIVEADYVSGSTVAANNLAKFKEIVAGIKKVAPRSDEFIYFVCRAIHSMEAANLDPITGAVTGDGYVDEATGTWKTAAGKTPFPYCNANGDAFPEAELLKVVGEKDGHPVLAYQTFIGRGLFVNHASDDAEKIRGIILDATWDPKTKGVDLLVACDKIAYPELARQIQAGYSNDVSMGTQVQYSVCSTCGNKAKVEADYCTHVKTAKGGFLNGRPVYEANFGLNFIEISVVATGADPKAKIRQVLAHLNTVMDNRTKMLATDHSEAAIKAAKSDCDEMRKALAALSEVNLFDHSIKASLSIDQIEDTQNPSPTTIQDVQASLKAIQQKIADLQKQVLDSKGTTMSTSKEPVKAYLKDEGQGELNKDEQNKAEFKQDYTKVRDTQDKQMVGKGMESGKDGMHPGYGESDEKVKERLQRAELDERKQKREALLQRIAYLKDEGQGELNKDEQNKSEFKQNYTKVRDTQDKQMVGKGMESGKDGMHPGYGESDEAVKNRLQRAKARARLLKAADKSQSKWVVMLDDKEVLTASATDFYGSDVNAKNPENPSQTNAEWVNSKEFGINLLAAIREFGLDHVKAEIARVTKEAACSMNKDEAPKPFEKKEDKAEDKKDDKKDDKKEEPKAVEKKAQLAPGADLAMGAPAEQPGMPAEAGKKKEDEEGEGADININVGTEDNKEAGASSIPEDTKSALQGVASELASVGEELAAIIGGGEGLLDDAAAKETEDVGGEVADSGDELAELDKALGEASAVEDKGDPALAEKAAAAKTEINKLITAAVSDTKAVVVKAKAVIAKANKMIEEKKKEKAEKEKKEDKKEAKSSLADRKAARARLAAEAKKLYDLTNDGMMEKDAHPKGNTTAVPGHEFKTQSSAHDVGEKVAEKNPTGKLTAAQEARRAKVVSFVKSANPAAPVTPAAKAEELANKPAGAPVAAPAAAAPTAAKPGEVKTAAADAESKSYYKELFNSDPEAKSFATDLVKDFAGKTSKADLENATKKMHRAYRTALRQVKLQQIASTQEAVENQVNTLVKLSDDAFTAFETAVANTAVTKNVQASDAGVGSLLKTASAQNLEQGEKVSNDPMVASANEAHRRTAELVNKLANLGWSTSGHR